MKLSCVFRTFIEEHIREANYNSCLQMHTLDTHGYHPGYPTCILFSDVHGSQQNTLPLSLLIFHFLSALNTFSPGIGRIERPWPWPLTSMWNKMYIIAAILVPATPFHRFVKSFHPTFVLSFPSYSFCFGSFP